MAAVGSVGVLQVGTQVYLAFDYQGGSNPTELAGKAGEIFTVTASGNENWVQVLTADGRNGFLPRKYVQPFDPHSFEQMGAASALSQGNPSQVGGVDSPLTRQPPQPAQPQPQGFDPSFSRQPVPDPSRMGGFDPSLARQPAQGPPQPFDPSHSQMGGYDPSLARQPVPAPQQPFDPSRGRQPEYDPSRGRQPAPMRSPVPPQRNGDKFTNGPILSVPNVTATPLEQSQFRGVYDQTGYLRDLRPDQKMGVLIDFLNRNGIPVDLITKDNNGVPIQTAEECVARLWTMEEGGVYNQIISALLFDHGEALSRFGVLLRLLNMYITPRRVNQQVFLYRGGSASNMVATRDVIRQPLYVSLTEDISEAKRLLRRGAPLIEYIADPGCVNCAPIAPNLSFFPSEKEWILPPYTPVKYAGERFDPVNQVTIITVDILDGGHYFEEKILPSQVFLHPLNELHSSSSSSSSSKGSAYGR